MRDAIHALKYGRLHPAARRLGSMLAEAIEKLKGQAPAEMLVVPVPLHRSKYSQRGFNQSLLLAREALWSLGKSRPRTAWRLTLAPGTLVRVRATASQAGLTAHGRRRNLRAAFAVRDAAAVAGRHVLLVDDIMTTGATARAAAQALVRAGAESVWVATLARAQRSGASGIGFKGPAVVGQEAGEWAAAIGITSPFPQLLPEGKQLVEAGE